MESSTFRPAIARFLAASIVFLSAALQAQPEVEIEFISSFGTKGAAPGQFDTLRGITIGNNGEVIVADAGNERIQVCDISGDCFAFGSGGTGAGEFNNPHGVAVDSTDRIVTVETNTDRIQIFSATGEWIQMFGTRGSALGQFRIPGGVWVDPLDRILVADENNDRIQICSSAGQCTAFGSFGAAAGQFGTPRAVAVDDEGHILVSERDNNRISICTETGECSFFSGPFAGNAVGQFDRPRELIPDGAGNIIIADGDNHRLQVCTYEGECVAFGELGSGPGQFIFPVGVAMDDQSRLYVADQENHRVQVFEYYAGFRLDPGLNGNWWAGLERSGEGAQVEVADGGDGSLVFVATVYSYDTQGNQIFLVAVGTVEGDAADVDIYITEGGVWGDTFDPALVVETQWGTGTFSASGCEAMNMVLKPNAEYQSLGYTDLEYDLVRLTTPLAPCPAAN